MPDHIICSHDLLVAEVIPGTCCVLGEGPVWDEQNQKLLFVDIVNGAIHQYSPQKGWASPWNAGQMVGAVALCADGRLVAALENGFAFIDLSNPDIHPIVDPESHLVNNRFNDGKCDPQGRFWAGTMDHVHGLPGAGSLYRLNGDLSAHLMHKDVSCSNGLAWSPDGSTLYYIDTPSFQVVAFDFDGAAGAIERRRTVITIDPNQGLPDGMTIDSEGMLWIAHWNGWRITRWDPDSGKLLQTILIPVSLVTSCTFGGETLEDLYITSARIGLTDKDIWQQPDAGSVFVIKNCGAKGISASRFIHNQPG